MSQTPNTTQNAVSVKGIFERDTIKKKIQEMIGNKAPGFITSVLQSVSNNVLLSKADPMTIYNAAMIAATLDLPINPNLGFAYIVPYKGQAAFQMGYRGYIQLAQRTGQYEAINMVKIYENQFKSFNALTEELNCDFTIQGSGKIVGYAAYFRLVNGFSKTSYWSTEQVTEHAKRFSQSFGSNSSPWKTDFDAMAMKTVLKNTLAKWGILSIEMQMAVKTDQAVIRDENGQNVDYPDGRDEFQDAEVVVDEKKATLRDKIEATENPASKMP
jgi:recombination protein RecT